MFSNKVMGHFDLTNHFSRASIGPSWHIDKIQNALSARFAPRERVFAYKGNSNISWELIFTVGQILVFPKELIFGILNIMFWGNKHKSDN